MVSNSSDEISNTLVRISFSSIVSTSLAVIMFVSEFVSINKVVGILFVFCSSKIILNL